MGGGKYWKLPSNPSQPHSKTCRVVAPAAHEAEEESPIPPWTTENLRWPRANQHHGEEAGWGGVAGDKREKPGLLLWWGRQDQLT